MKSIYSVLFNRTWLELRGPARIQGVWGQRIFSILLKISDFLLQVICEICVTSLDAVSAKHAAQWMKLSGVNLWPCPGCGPRLYFNSKAPLLLLRQSVFVSRKDRNHGDIWLISMLVQWCHHKSSWSQFVIIILNYYVIIKNSHLIRLVNLQKTLFLLFIGAISYY